MTRSKVLIIVFAIIIIFVAVLIISEDKNVEDKKFNIVTTFYPVEVIVNNIAKGVNDVENINISSGVGGCIHDYELTPADMKNIEKADVIVINGQGMEHFAKHIQLKDKIVDSSINIPNKEVSSHIWMDFDNYISQIQVISTALAKYDAENSQMYMENMNKYIQKVEVLKQEIQMVKSNTNVGIMHDSLNYYSKMGCFNVSAQFFSGHEGNYSANDIKNFIEKINSTNTKVILVDSQTYKESKQLVDMIQKETGAKVYDIDLIVEVNSNLNDYIDKMSVNIQKLKEAVSYGE